MISSNLIGIQIEDGAIGNAVLGNLIGTNAAGTIGLSGTSAGIGIFESSGNTIGGTNTESRNVISGNAIGVYLIADELAATDNMLQGNFIGTDVTGTSDVGNDIGVLIGAGGNIVGGTSAIARNVISGNDVTGLVIGNFTSALTPAAMGNLVQGNLIGINATDNTPLPNGGGDFDEIAARFNQVILETTGEAPDVTASQLAAIEGGLAIALATGNTIGGAGTGAGNVISANTGSGIKIFAADNNVVQGNIIGTDLVGIGNLGNSGAGVSVDSSLGNTIADNTIAFNSFAVSGTGVALNAGANNAIRRNSMYQNGGLGIDLGGDGVTPTTADDTDVGANRQLNFPVLETATIADGNLIIAGFARPDSEIELFIADPDPSGFGEGRTFLLMRTEGSTEDGDSTTGTYGPTQINGLDQGTDTTNRFSFVIPIASLPEAVAEGTMLTATATDASGNTSEFSGNVTAMSEVAPLTVGIANALAVTEGGGSVFDVTISRPLEDGEQVVVTYGTSDDTAAAPGDYIAVSGATLIFDFEDPLTKSVSIATIDDDIPENEETFQVNITATGVSDVGAASATGTILDNDRDGPSITATKIDSLAIDNDSNEKADAGDVIGYTIQIGNSGDGDATDVRFSDTLDPNTTLDTDSVTVTPLALDDSYSVVPDMPITVDAAGGLLANDFDIDGTAPGTNAELTFVISSVSRVSGDVTGTFAPDSDGGFTYTPPIGERGTEVFEYNIIDADNLNAVVPGFVTFNVSSNIWFIDNSRTSNGDGSLANPFNSFDDVNGPGGGGDVDGPGDIIFVFEGDVPYDQSFQLEVDQQLIGEGVGLTLNGSVIVPIGNRPTLTQSNPLAGVNGEAIRLADNNTIAGMNVSDTVASGLQADLVNGGLVEDVTITNAGAVGIDLDQCTGTFTFDRVDIFDAIETGLLVDRGDVNVEFGSTAPSSIQTSAGTAFGAAQGHAGTITFGSQSSIEATAGDGLQFDDADGTYNFEGQITLDGTANSADTGIDIVSDSAGTFTFSGTFSDPIVIKNDQGVAFNMDDSPGTATLDSFDVSQSMGAGIRANNSGTLHVLNTDIDNTTGDGINVTNTNVMVNFAQIGLNVGIGDDGIEVVNNDGVDRTATITSNNIFELAGSSGIANRGIFINSSGTGTLEADVRFNQISSTNQTILTTSGPTAGSLILDLQNSTLTTNTPGCFHGRTCRRWPPFDDRPLVG